MDALVVYESMYGNTRAVAEAIADGLGGARVRSVRDASEVEADLLLVGGSTHMHGLLRSVGIFSNRLLLYGIAFELALSAVIIYAPPLQSLLGTAALPPDALLLTLPFPFIVWGADELRRWLLRRRRSRSVVDRRTDTI